ncbi:amidohydrolase family protein [Acetobacter papayae]|uniref:amidohydrolase family protein n=1 Tax=Acetobacter papayae TaxID=1076592 RepID=UPI0039E9143A
MKPAFAAVFIALLGASPAIANPVALTHVRLIDGTGSPPTEDMTILIDGPIIRAVGQNLTLPPGTQVLDRTGDTVMPGLISDHSHVGQVGGTTTGPQFYTRDTITAELGQYRRYGVTTVTALGNNAPILFDTLRQEAHARQLPADLFGVDAGIGVPRGAPPVNVAPDQLIRPRTPTEAREAVGVMAAHGTDLVKIWVDDFDHSLPVKMKPAIITAVVEESHRRGLRVAAHIHDLADAQRVVAAGVNILAHGVRDKPVPPAFVDTLRTKGIWYIPTLELDEASTAWADEAPWTRTAFTRAGLSTALQQQITDPAWRQQHASGKQARFARDSLAINLQNLKTLHDAGVKIGFGTDSGAMPLRVPGIAEHRELALSVQAGLSPLETIKLATGNAADLMGLTDRGRIAPGLRADLLVVEGNPASDIRDADRIVETWENGTSVPGPLSHNGN